MSAENLTIQSIVQKVEASNAKTLTKGKVIINSIALLGAGALLFLEVILGEVSQFIIYSKTDEYLRSTIPMVLISVLSFLAFAGLLTVLNMALDKEVPLGVFLKRFPVVAIGPLFSELVVMTMFLSFTIYAGVPTLVAPLLLLFVGNFLIQGHIFVLPAWLSLSVSLLCYVLSAIVYFTQWNSILPGLIIFCALNMASIFFLKKGYGGRHDSK